MKAFTAPLKNLEELQQIRDKLKKNKGILQVSGCIESQKAHFAYCVGQEYSRKLIITYSDIRARELYENYRFYDKKVLLYPARDLIFFQADIQSNQIEKQRMEVLRALIEEQDITVITTLPGCMDRLLPLEALKEHVLEYTCDSTLDLQKLAAKLVEMGYEKVTQVEGSGQFAIRGGIIDIFPLTEENPVRMELWGDEIDSIRSFDIMTQRSIENLEELKIYPANETIISQNQIENALKKIEKESRQQEEKFREAMKTEEAHRVKMLADEIRERLVELEERTGLDSLVPYFYEKTVSFLDYFGEESLLFLDEPNRIIQEARAV